MQFYDGLRKLGLTGLSFSSLFAAACKKEEPPPAPPPEYVARNDYATEAYVDGNGRKQAYFGIETPRGDTILVPTGSLDSARNLSRRVHGGDRVQIVGNTVRVVRPNPYGEIPFERNLVVESYDIEKLRDFRSPSRVDNVVATIGADFSVGNVDEHYTIKITAQNEAEAERTVRNLQRYNVLRIREQRHSDLNGETVKDVYVKPTERGPELIVPAYRLAWRDLFGYDVDEREPRPRGRITPDSVFEPWKLRPTRPVQRPRTDTRIDSLGQYLGSRIDSLRSDVGSLGEQLSVQDDAILDVYASVSRSGGTLDTLKVKMDSVAAQVKSMQPKVDSALAGQRRRRGR